jgi:ubiquinone/menaquinone biosynthesis C-methylase UbiE/DNA-binding transcriptional ArsR family regulator
MFATAARSSALPLAIETLSDFLKAAAEPTRLRVLALLSKGEMTVTDLTQVLSQSQPRVSRHLRLLVEAGLATRAQEGSWAWFRLADTAAVRDLSSLIARHLDAAGPVLKRDRERLAEVRAERQAQAADYFARNAAGWDALRALHVDEAAVEAAMLEAIKGRRIDAMLDLGTGTGRMLEVFAPHYRSATGIDASREMLAVARAKLEAAGIATAALRSGDVSAPQVESGRFDLVTIHQVLHFLEEPAAAIREAAKAMRPGGTILIVDFAPHGLEHLRETLAHRRLGFSDAQIAEWLADCGLLPGRTLTFSATGREGLTVKLWTARDPRIVIAETEPGPEAGVARPRIGVLA